MFAKKFAQATFLVAVLVGSGFLLPRPVFSQSGGGFERGRLRSNDGRWLAPVASTILSSDEDNHSARGAVIAWDMTAPEGSAVYPMSLGTVIYAGCNNAGGYGCWALVDHGDGFSSVYCHLLDEGGGTIMVRKGEEVGAWTQLGRVGWTGMTSFGPHVHWEIRKGAQVKIDQFFDRSELEYCKFCSAKGREFPKPAPVPVPQLQPQSLVGAGLDRWWPFLLVLGLIALLLVVLSMGWRPVFWEGVLWTGEKMGKALLWLTNKTLELIGKIWRFFEKLGEKQSLLLRVQQRRFHPLRAGGLAAFELCGFLLILAFVSTLVVGGTPLERIVGGRTTLIGQLVSRASAINPEVYAFGLEPVVQQSGIDQKVVAASALPTFSIEYWTAKQVTFQAPTEIWQAVTDAASKHGCDPYLVVAVAHSESPVYNNTATSSAGCLGVWQFYPGTWDRYTPYVGAARTDISAAADAACRMITDLNLTGQTSELNFARRFNGADDGQCWNCADTDGSPSDPAVRQAKYVWRLWQQLLAETQGGE